MTQYGLRYLAVQDLTRRLRRVLLRNCAMQLSHGLHLAYSTNVHRGETWGETLRSLEQHTLKVKAAISPDAPFGIGLRLGEELALPYL